ncbi:hypothetical protein [Halorussus sp. AFM4]|uniref:hypothetical protein n=1 Tax=Halorussus sp. AFM4 TaxID=3421651 RepID=UPI003EBAD3BD
METRNSTIRPYHKVFLELNTTVNASALFRESIDNRIQQLGYDPQALERSIEAIQNCDRSLQAVLEDVTSIEEFHEQADHLEPTTHE